MTLSLGQARATAQDMLQRAQHLPMARMEAHVAMANTLFWLGTAKKPWLASPAEISWAGTPGGADMQGFDLSTLALTLEGLAAFQCGRFAQARTAMDILHQRASAQHHTAFNRVMALQGAGWLAALFEATNQLAELGQALHTLAHSQELDFYQASAASWPAVPAPPKATAKAARLISVWAMNSISSVTVACCSTRSRPGNAAISCCAPGRRVSA